MSKEKLASKKADGQGRQNSLRRVVRVVRLLPWASLRKEVALMEQFLLDVLANVLAGVIVVLVAPYLKR